jgi:hypothetical protein
MTRTERPPRWILAAAAVLLLGAAYAWWQVGDAVWLRQLNGMLC